MQGKKVNFYKNILGTDPKKGPFFKGFAGPVPVCWVIVKRYGAIVKRFKLCLLESWNL